MPPWRQTPSVVHGGGGPLRPGRPGRLPIDLLPNPCYPSLTVETRFPGAAPAEVEALVTRRVEEAVGILSGVRRITSRSLPGLSQVTLEYAWGRQMALASLDVRQKVDLITLPQDAENPTILRFDPSTDPVMRLYLSGGDNLFRLRYVAEEISKKDLESLDSVAAVKLGGGLDEEIQPTATRVARSRRTGGPGWVTTQGYPTIGAWDSLQSPGSADLATHLFEDRGIAVADRGAWAG